MFHQIITILIMLLISSAVFASQEEHQNPEHLSNTPAPEVPQYHHEKRQNVERLSNIPEASQEDGEEHQNIEYPSDSSVPKVSQEGHMATDMTPDVLAAFEPENRTEYAIVVEKETQQFFVYAHDGKRLRQVWRMDCSTGKKNGPKTRAGDLRTPEGVYFFIKIHEKKDLAPIYGIRAFPTDYPNIMDRIAGRTGNAIWLHGTNKPLKERDSSGCVALQNTDIERVTDHISLNRTPMIVVERLSHSAPDPGTKEDIQNLLSGWENAIGQGTYHDYLNYYDADYLPDISWWSEWNKTRKTIQPPVQPLSVKLKNMLILKHKAVYVVLSDQFVRFSDKELPAGIRKFFLTREHGQFRIIGEEYQGLPKVKKENPFVVAYHNLEQVEQGGEEGEQEIANMIDDWLKAWSSKDIDRYGNHYASDFRSQGMNLSSWLKHKKRLNQKYDYIRVAKKNRLRVKKSSKKRTVSFVQTYESSAFKAQGVKQLVLKRESGQWKIYRETWKKM